VLYHGYGAFSVNQFWHRNWVLVFKEKQLKSRTGASVNTVLALLFRLGLDNYATRVRLGLG